MQQQKRGDRTRGLMVCAWCSRYLGTVKGVERVSHGICLECKTRELARWGVRRSVAGSLGAHQGGPSGIGARMGEGARHP
jgi:hypothetical protein